jgi:Tol biopolymer transport system component
VHDRSTGTTSRVTIATDGTPSWGENPTISADGRYVAFESIRSNLVPGDTNDVSDVFVRDRSSGTTIRVSVASDATQTNAASSWPSISADGRSIAFESFASNLVPNDTNGTSDVFVHERSTT